MLGINLYFRWQIYLSLLFWLFTLIVSDRNIGRWRRRPGQWFTRGDLIPLLKGQFSLTSQKTSIVIMPFWWKVTIYWRRLCLISKNQLVVFRMHLCSPVARYLLRLTLHSAPNVLVPPLRVMPLKNETKISGVFLFASQRNKVVSIPTTLIYINRRNKDETNFENIADW